MSVRMNRAMRRYVEQVADMELPDSLLADPEVAALFASTPLETDDRALVLPWTPNWATVPRKPLTNLTGYEAFVNHVHLDDIIFDKPDASRLQLKLGLMLGEHLATRLHTYGPVTVIMSFDGKDAVVRVHKTRPGEQWLAEDLEGFEEGVLVIEQ